VGIVVREKTRGSGVFWVFVTWQGRRRAKRIGDLAAAQAIASQLRARLALGDASLLASRPTTPPTPAVTFAQLAADWLVWYPSIHAIRPSTLENHESFLRAHLVPFFGATPVAEITPDLVEDFIAAKRATGGSRRRDGKGLADSYLKLGLGTLSLILSRAVRRKLLSAHPMDQADWRATQRPDTVDPFTGVELRAILSAAAPDFATLVRCWVQGGFREGELLALRDSDLDLEQGTARVERTWSRQRLGPTKTGATRTVSVLHPVTEDTSAWQATPASRVLLAQLKARAVVSMDPDAYVFGAGAGRRPLNPAVLRRRWRRTLLRAKVRYRAPEMLRHTWASTMLSKNAPLLYVQKQGGWRSATVLLRVYSRWMPDALPGGGHGGEKLSSAATPLQPDQRA
jgi:integrase